jgi:hypothetical protein
MPLSEQEHHCVELACEFLSSAVGGRWAVESYPDDLNHTEPTPEVVVANGETTAAIEVKMMTGDLAQRKYRESLYSNERYLVPPCGGYYWLEPPVDLRLPINMVLRRQVKKEIERVAPMLQPGGKGVLRIPRNGHISLISERNPAVIFCVHSGPYSDLWRPLIERLEGRFLLVDEGLEHSFFTDEGREAFYDAVASACGRRLGGDASTFTWNEEWQITRLEDGGEEEDDKDGVWIMACTEARSVPDTISECLNDVLDNALRKFTKRWACLHVLVLEENVSAHTELIRETVASLGPSRLPNVDRVLLVANDKVIQCYP